MDGLRSCSQCGEVAISDLCFSCERQHQIDNSDWTPICCPECKSSLCIQHDWTKPIYVCELCGHEFTDPDGNWYDESLEFADPFGVSALRAATSDNPRNQTCPTCGKPDRLTPKDRALGYQCDQCAEEQERGY